MAEEEELGELVICRPVVSVMWLFALGCAHIGPAQAVALAEADFRRTMIEPFREKDPNFVKCDQLKSSVYEVSNGYRVKILWLPDCVSNEILDGSGPYLVGFNGSIIQRR